MTSSTSYTGTATMHWDMSTAADLSGYRVYIGDATRLYDATKTQTFGVITCSTGQPAAVVTGIYNGILTYATVTAFDVAGNESTYSAEVTLERQVPLIHLLRQFR
jgi:hypothetical protein